MRIVRVLACLCAILAPAAVQAASPFAGRWNFNIAMPNGTRASWLGVTEKNGTLEIWFQPTGGNVYQVKDFKVSGPRLTMMLAAAKDQRPALSWELEAVSKDKLTGTQQRGSTSTPLTGVRAPDLKRPAPKAWSAPEPLFNGKNLDGWEAIGNAANSRWAVKDGLLVNEARGANLKTTRVFDDFKLHFEVNAPDHTNSGMYLRGRYEMQIENEPEGTEPPERAMGSIYGRIAPIKRLPKKPGEWQTFDITLVGRTITIAHNGTTIVDRQEIEGITGGALDANEGEPGPFYIQGDHGGGLKFRNITISTPQR